MIVGDGPRLAGSCVGILAGGGPLPGQVARTVERLGRRVFIVGFQDFAEPGVVEPWPHRYIRLAAAGEILSCLRAEGCRDLVLIGPVRRPSFSDLRPDAAGVRIMGRIGRALFSGDDGLLAAIVRVLAEEGFVIHGAHEFLSGSVGRSGVLGRIQPDSGALADIRRGQDVVEAIGRLDIGQGCVVQDGLVLAVEAMEGTDRMLLRAGECRQPGRPGGVLVKMLKPGQDLRADLPTIGSDTVRRAAEVGLRGIAFQAGATLMIDSAACVAAADETGLFLMGINEGAVGVPTGRTGE
ncbi:UDP-2,3-diacylglucosamine diphosphatase LpxI [Gluconacetobacter sp. 1b LMG 1731]|uniref:UDP-2,3-diacylglucosamine diphosphatase LpxI n=1 Tax=Gluconacetobacter dulcium TaxID=2729096 RepID=A0A7W4IP74_9PROT|nr:UDP-2,3-diacylglucosamine diphosphatase LpxI [Gluconacetobacter dulcium]MBB2166521.1 UDP-2,3-diacylglucosamine diphosphatase LpxI [Gluconacetobacter dulcium]MBB2192619.1 UDP-2,3-diacylglucosamine diphosphatase LpxI [Gluconacetobacter dulcium]